MFKKSTCLALLATSLAWGNTEGTSNTKKEVHFGLEGFHYSYTEPKLMNMQGLFGGIHGGIRFITPKRFTWSLDGRFAYGKTNYRSRGTGRMKGEPNFLAEGRGLFGKEFGNPHRWVFEPFMGIGYRYKADTSEGRKSTTGHWGYDRTSHYLYVPMGLCMNKQLNNAWDLSLKGEFDLFVFGKMYSESEIVNMNHEFDQTRGYGLRGEVLVGYQFGKGKICFGPFMNWWEVDHSTVDRGYVEPHNHTLETGIKLSYKF